MSHKRNAGRPAVQTANLDELGERYILAVESAIEGLWDWNLKDDTVFFSSTWKEILGCAPADIANTTAEWFDRLHPEDRAGFDSALQACFEGRLARFQHEYRLLHSDGSYHWFWGRGAALRNDSGKAVRMIGLQRDVTEQKIAEAKLSKALNDLKFALASEKVLLEELDRKNKRLVELSITDGLTELYNHRFLQERLDFEFKRARRYGDPLCVMILDIDFFKTINDTYGHQFGDLVLCELAKLLKSHTREVDICGRYGGEEFMILCRLRIKNCLSYASRLHRLIEAREFSNGDTDVHLTVSIGIAEYRPDCRTKQQLIERADRALYQAKEDGRNLVRVWKEDVDTESNSLDTAGIEHLTTEFKDLSDRMRSAYIDSTNALIKAVNAKDPRTRQHTRTVARLAVKLARYMSLPDETVEIIRYAALLHDVGMIGIDQEILIKNRKLTAREMKIYQKHPIIGAQILKDIRFLEYEIPVILHHHERYDGSGFPQGLKGREIPIGAMIVGIVDSYDSFVMGRHDLRALTSEQACAEIRKRRGAWFTEEITDAFLEMMGRGAHTTPVRRKRNKAAGKAPQK